MTYAHNHGILNSDDNNLNKSNISNISINTNTNVTTINSVAYIEKYDGEWSDNKMHGRGCYNYADGGCYDGMLVI